MVTSQCGASYELDDLLSEFDLSHWSHTHGLSPVWLLICNIRLLLACEYLITEAALISSIPYMNNDMTYKMAT